MYAEAVIGREKASEMPNLVPTLVEWGAVSNATLELSATVLLILGRQIPPDVYDLEKIANRFDSEASRLEEEARQLAAGWN